MMYKGAKDFGVTFSDRQFGTFLIRQKFKTVQAGKFHKI